MALTLVSRGRHARVRATPFRKVALRAVVGLTAGGVLMLTVLRLVNLSAVYQRLTHLSIGFGLLCGAAFLTAYVVRALRWRCLLRPCQVSVRRAIAIYQVATFLNWLLPVRGGELAKSLLLRHTDGIPVSRSLATVSMDKFMDLLPSVGLLAILPVVGLHLSRPLWVLLVSALTVLGVAGGVLALASRQRNRAVALLTRPLVAALPRGTRKRTGPFIAQFVDTLLALIRQPRLLLKAAAYTVVAVGLDALFCFLAFKAVGVAIPLVVVLYGYTLFNVAFILPTPPGQVGSNEFIGLLIFSGMFGVNRSGVLAMFLFSHPWTALLMTGTGLACLSAMGLTLRSTLRLAREQGDRNAPEPEDWKRQERENLTAHRLEEATSA